MKNVHITPEYSLSLLMERQGLTEELNTLKARIAELENRLDRLEGKGPWID